jgi:hypothetical protein
MTTLAFLIDVDNTLIDNDFVKSDLHEHIRVQMGDALADRFWELYEKTREDGDVINIPLALKRLRKQTSLSELDEHTYQHVHSLFDNYPFFDALYPHALEALKYLRTIGLTVITSDGDMFFQAEKIFNSSIAETVEGRVLLFTHKQEHLSEIIKQYPADHYAMIDDKSDILAESKFILGAKLTTTLVLQGKYATLEMPENFTPDLILQHIGDVCKCTREQFLHV